MANKKVLLRERKRHTDRRLSSTSCTVLSWGGGGVLPLPGVPHPDMVGGTPSHTGDTPSQFRGTPWLGYPPVLTWPGGTPSQSGDTPHPDLAMVLPPPPQLDLARVPPPPHWTWPGYPPPRWTWLGYSLPGVPPPLPVVDRRTDTCQNITFPHTTYAVGNKRDCVSAVCVGLLREYEPPASGATKLRYFFTTSTLQIY